MTAPTERYSKSGRFVRASLRVAMHIRGLYEERGSSDTRLLESFFLPDEHTLVGVSHAWRASGDKGRREHVVPRLVIIKACHAMVANGENDAAIACVIRDNVKIVMITEEECQRLDGRQQHGFKQCMPKKWKVGDDPFARLTTAGIAWDPVSDAAEVLRRLALRAASASDASLT
jgi:hypothetical protein